NGNWSDTGPPGAPAASAAAQGSRQPQPHLYEPGARKRRLDCVGAASDTGVCHRVALAPSMASGAAGPRSPPCQRQLRPRRVQTRARLVQLARAEGSTAGTARATESKLKTLRADSMFPPHSPIRAPTRLSPWRTQVAECWGGVALCTAGVGTRLQRGRFLGNLSPGIVRVDGGWSSWGEFSSCSSSCGDGIGDSKPALHEPASPVSAAALLSGSANDSRSCNLRPCPIDGQWSEWSTFSGCSRSCGLRQAVARPPVRPARSRSLRGSRLPRGANETRECNTNPCPVDGGWSAWSAFADCSVTCGNGSHSRQRSCSSPEPQFGRPQLSLARRSNSATVTPRPCPRVAQCEPADAARGAPESRSAPTRSLRRGKTAQDVHTATEACLVTECPRWTASVGSWGAWERLQRHAAAASKPPGEAALRLPGASVWRQPLQWCRQREHPCHPEDCPIKRRLVALGRNSRACSRSLRGGQRSRTRRCDPRRPTPRGADCVGSGSDVPGLRPRTLAQVWLVSYKTMRYDEAEAGRQWSAWAAAAQELAALACLVQRSRGCTNPVPEFGGDDCAGEAVQSTPALTSPPAPCEARPAPNTPATSPSAPGEAALPQNTACDIPVCPDRKTGGGACVGTASDGRQCNTDPCPIDGVLSAWSEVRWSGCSTALRYRKSTRQRVAARALCRSLAAGAAQAAAQTAFARLPTRALSRVLHGGWRTWTEFSNCSVTCGNGEPVAGAAAAAARPPVVRWPLLPALHRKPYLSGVCRQRLCLFGNCCQGLHQLKNAEVGKPVMIDAKGVSVGVSKTTENLLQRWPCEAWQADGMQKFTFEAANTAIKAAPSRPTSASVPANLSSELYGLGALKRNHEDRDHGRSPAWKVDTALAELLAALTGRRRDSLAGEAADAAACSSPWPDGGGQRRFHVAGARGSGQQRTTESANMSLTVGGSVHYARAWSDLLGGWVWTRTQRWRRSPASKRWCSRATSSARTRARCSSRPTPSILATVFNNFAGKLAENFVTLLVLCLIIGIYVVVSVWMWRLDRQEAANLRYEPLEDNEFDNDYTFIISVYTGDESGADTTSNVFINLAGTWGSSGKRQLSDGVRQNFSRGSVCNFAMTTRAPLGELRA
uniref:PLAT domain-containing protein n=1 Tax=Macrostomum lignano TaxID=282301 RepID=A0A1I8F9M2_9PLAT